MEAVAHLIETLLSPVIGLINRVLWDYVLVYGLLAVGLYFTVRLRFVQVRRFPHMLHVIGRGTGGTTGVAASGGRVTTAAMKR